MSTYNNTFGGNFIQPSTVSYNSIELTSNVILTWPTAYQDDAPNQGFGALNRGNILASYMTIQADQQTPLVINLGNDPIATKYLASEVSVTVPSTSNLFPGTLITISGADDTHGITANQLNITANILGIQGGVEFTYLSNGTANALGTGGGNSVVLTYSVPYAITLPDATKVSVGTSIQFINNGEYPFFIADNAQNFLVTVNIGNSFQLLLIDNTSTYGIWQILQAGTGTAIANASAIAGLGLTTLNGTLNTNFPSKFLDGNYTSISSDRGSLLVWTGGVGTINLFANAPTGFPESINNSGGGIVTVSTTDGSTIDGEASFSLNPGESSQFISTSSGTTWNSLGFGQETFFAVNTLSLNIAAGGTINLTNQQSSRLVQTYTGALAQNAIITFPAAPGQWYVWNNTTNNYTVTLKLFGVGGGFIIPQGEKLIVYSDGNQIYSTPTTATNAIFNPGSVGSPSIVFTNDATTGFYSSGPGEIGYSSQGTISLDLTGYGLGVYNGGQVRFYQTPNTNYVAFKAGALTSTTTWTLPLTDATSSRQIIFSDAAGNLSFTTATYPSTTTANQLLYSSSNNTIAGLATEDHGVLLTDGSGVPSIGTATVSVGGTGVISFTPYSLLLSNTTSTGAFVNIPPGVNGKVLTAKGAGAYPVWGNLQIFVYGNFTNLSSTPVENQSLNINTLTVNSAGNYTVTFNNPFTDTGYIVLITISNHGLFAGQTYFSGYTVKLTNQITIIVFDEDGVSRDPDELNITLIGS